MLRSNPCRHHGVLAALTVVSIAFPAHAKVEFKREFAPQDGLVSRTEKSRRSEICLNGKWQFQPLALPTGFRQGQGVLPELPAPSEASWDATPIRIPSPWNVNSFPDDKGQGGDFRTFPSYPDSWKSVQMGWLRRSITVPAAWKGKRLILHFGAVAGHTRILLNGKTVGTHDDIFLPFDIDVTDAVNFGANTLLVGVQKSSLRDVQGQYGSRPYQGGSFWGQHIAGIWQDVFLEAVPTVHVTDVFVKPSVDTGTLEAQVTVHNDTIAPAKISLGGEVYGWHSLAGKDVLSAPEPKWNLDQKSSLQLSGSTVSVPAGGDAVLTLRATAANRLKLWTPETPNLYSLVCNLKNSAGKTADIKSTRFGWRQLTFQKGKVLLNGQPLIIKGDSWHFMGIPQMTRRYAWAWFKAAKDANLNAVRLHAQPYPSFYLDVADEMGILVLDESAMWASDGGPKLDDPAYWADSETHIKGLVLRDRNHPSVFGWSVSNEVLPVIRNVFHGPKSMEEELVRHFQIWSDICRANDPTRPWISADGEDDGEGTLPTNVNHYGGPDSMKRALASGKPWGVGEAGPAYYGSPEEIARFASDPNAYLSFQDRMEGVAAVSFQNLADQRQFDASYRSVFNLVWYGLQPLELGLKDKTRAPQLTDGIFFGPYVEGKPGVQPERLGPYSSTLNPGYDPGLPLYRTWPLFDAIRDAQGATLVQYKPPHPFDAAPQNGVPPKNTVAVAQVLAGNGSELEKNLADQGVPVETKAWTTQLLFLDGAQPPTADAKPVLQQTLNAGGTVFVWGASPQTLSALNALLPSPIELTTREASSLVPLTPSPLLSGVTPAGFYFSELSPSTIMTTGLDGPFVQSGTSILGANNTDWKRWNRQSEPTKTAMVLRSEREAKPSGVALAELKVGAGRILICTLPVTPQSPKAAALNRTLLTNLGLVMSDAATQRNILDGTGAITKALALGNFAAGSVDEALAASPVKPDSGRSVATGSAVGDRIWASVAADASSEFDLKDLKKVGGAFQSTYLSFWLFSPKALDNLLLDPHLPVLDLAAKNATAAQFWLNGKPLPTKTQNDAVVAPTLLLEQGWNHILVKVVRATDAGTPSLQLSSSQPEFLGQLRGAQQVGPDAPQPSAIASNAPNTTKLQTILAAEKEGGIVVSSERDEAGKNGRQFKTVGQWNTPGAWATGETTNRATWEANLPKSGNYRVEIWYGEDPNRDHATHAAIHIRSADGQADKQLNFQTLIQQWVPLGTYRFSADQAAKVTLDGANAGGNLIADMVRFVPAS